jgi:nanoRNase/pAp phosphatase (c-di-AMP/oligoRNAs hydrolase)
LKLEKVDVVVVYGIIGDSVYISARSWDEQLHVGKLLKKAFKGLGKAGGHPLIGGATIPLEDFSKNFEEELIERVLQAKSTHS